MVDVILYAAAAGIVIFCTLYRKSEESIPFVPCLYFGYFLASMDISVAQAISDALLKLLEM
jgi:prepilin signal peptidase PulO-like enzyme (type II secretory pathway)